LDFLLSFRFINDIAHALVAHRKNERCGNSGRWITGSSHRDVPEGDYASKYHSARRKIHGHFSRRDMYRYSSYNIFGAEGATSSDKIVNGTERVRVFRPSFFH